MRTIHVSKSRWVLWLKVLSALQHVLLLKSRAHAVAADKSHSLFSKETVLLDKAKRKR